jgi:hypothetical protein
MSISPDQIILNAEQKDRLARLAEQTGRSWDEVLDEALAAFRAAYGSSGANGGESFYDAAIDQARSLACPFLTSCPVITEAAWLLRATPNGVSKLLEQVESGIHDSQSFVLLPA